MSFPIAKHGDTVVITIDDHLVVGNRQVLKRLVLDELARGECRFRLDFGRSRYVDSSGLGVLVAVSKLVAQVNGSLTLVNLDDDLKTLFVLTKLDTLFSFDESRKTESPGATRSAAIGDAPVVHRATSRSEPASGEAAPPL